MAEPRRDRDYLHMDDPTPRITRLREHALAVLEAGTPSREPELLAARAWMAHAGEPWTVVRRAQETAAILRGMTPVIDEGELLVGKPCPRALTPDEAAELERYRQWGAPARPPVLGQRAHMAIDYDKLLRLGADGLRRQIEGYRARLDRTRPEDLEKDAFYRACTIALEALVDCAHRYADLAEDMAEREADPQRRNELHQIAAACRRLPEFPARTFCEALQAVHFVTFCLCAGQRMLLFQLGRPDRYLLPLYRRDLAAGRITADEALEWIDCLALLLSEYTPRGLAVGWMVGGRDASGADVCNELTTLCLRSIGHTRLSYPGIGLCWTPDTPREMMELAADLLAQGLSHPPLFNDDVITSGMLGAGLPPAEACLYQNSTCVEITPIASSNVYVASPYINLLQLLHDLLGVPSVAAGPAGALPDSATVRADGGPTVRAHGRASLRTIYATFEALLAVYRARLCGAIRQAVIGENTNQATRRYNGGFPLLSCFVNDCLARGLDIDHGGARYNWIEPSFVGLSNLIDSLAAIRQYVYEEGTLDLEELAWAMADDFRGREDLRLMLLHRAPKYGNDDERVDALAAEITGWIADEVRAYTTYLGGRYLSGFFCWVMHERLGRATAASADGRRAGFPLGDGSGPAQGRERRGPTAAVLSATKWDHTPHLGGIAVNLKFSRPRDASAFQERLLDVVETYLRRGGFEVQVNVVDRETLLAAREHPEQYRDLVVRIGGYSDYFVGLSPEMQDEIILRTEHEM
jgi:pyruvate-formate lyase